MYEGLRIHTPNQIIQRTAYIHYSGNEQIMVPEVTRGTNNGVYKPVLRYKRDRITVRIERAHSRLGRNGSLRCFLDHLATLHLGHNWNSNTAVHHLALGRQSAGDQFYTSVRIDMTPVRLNLALNGTEKVVEDVPRSVHGLDIDDRLVTVPQRLGNGSSGDANLFIGPDGFDILWLTLNTNSSTSTESLPVRETVDVEFREHLVHSTNESIHLLNSVTGSNSESESFFTTSNGGVVDGLNVDIVFTEELVRSGLRQLGITNKDRDDVRRTGTKKAIRIL